MDDAKWKIRKATAADGSDLVLLTDAATRRLITWIFSLSAEVGQSPAEVARRSMQSDETSVQHLRNWDVVERSNGSNRGQVLGGLNSYRHPPVVDAPAESPTAPVLQPVNDLKRIAEGSWYISVASVFLENRGEGIGHAILALGEQKARAAGCDRLTLLVGSFNEGAHRLYQRFGMHEGGREAFVPFSGSDPDGDWILMVKDLI